MPRAPLLHADHKITLLRSAMWVLSYFNIWVFQTLSPRPGLLRRMPSERRCWKLCPVMSVQQHSTAECVDGLRIGALHPLRESKMKRFLPGTAALAALCLSIPAFAADLSARVTKAPPLISPAYDWSGFYLGVSAGYTFGEDEDITTTGQAAVN